MAIFGTIKLLVIVPLRLSVMQRPDGVRLTEGSSRWRFFGKVEQCYAVEGWEYLYNTTWGRQSDDSRVWRVIIAT